MIINSYSTSTTTIPSPSSLFLQISCSRSLLNPIFLSFPLISMFAFPWFSTIVIRSLLFPDLSRHLSYERHQKPTTHKQEVSGDTEKEKTEIKIRKERKNNAKTKEKWKCERLPLIWVWMDSKLLPANTASSPTSPSSQLTLFAFHHLASVSLFLSCHFTTLSKGIHPTSKGKWAKARRMHECVHESGFGSVDAGATWDHFGGTRRSVGKPHVDQSTSNYYYYYTRLHCEKETW